MLDRSSAKVISSLILICFWELHLDRVAPIMQSLCIFAWKCPNCLHYLRVNRLSPCIRATCWFQSCLKKVIVASQANQVVHLWPSLQARWPTPIKVWRSYFVMDSTFKLVPTMSQGWRRFSYQTWMVLTNQSFVECKMIRIKLNKWQIRYLFIKYLIILARVNSDIDHVSRVSL